jgi:hypothetical protein
MPRTKPTAPPTPQFSPLEVFASPQKKSRNTIQVQKQRGRYVQDTITKGVPPLLAQHIVAKMGTPKKINPATTWFTGKCALTNIPLQDMGDAANSAVFQPAKQRFISRIAERTIMYSKMTEAQFIQFCHLIVKAQDASTTANMGHASGLHQVSTEPGGRSRPADSRHNQRANILGLRQ